MKSSFFHLLSALCILFVVTSCEETPKLPPVVTTSEATELSPYTALSGGTIANDGGSAITARGVCWSEWVSPTLSDSCTVDGTGVGTFTSQLTGLKSGTRYFVRAYATNAKGTWYGNSVEFTTLTSAPELTTRAVDAITSFSAASGGTVLHNGGTYVIARGVCWSTLHLPTTENAKTVDGNGDGPYTSQLTGLKSGTVYYLRAYAYNESGTNYGNEVSFVTAQGVPELTTDITSALTTTTAISGGSISHDGGAGITERGVCWNTSPVPTIAHSKTSDGTGSGHFTSSMSDLQPGIRYYVRAYATNIIGTTYGNEFAFFTPQGDDVYSAATGKVWKNKNLGASRVATSVTDAEAYGDLYQWGRGTDGHEKRSSAATSTLSNSDSPGHGMYIGVSAVPADWRSTPNNELWQGVHGINNPCPEGYRVPTMAELMAERDGWPQSNSTAGFNSSLKLTLPGYRFGLSAQFYHVDKAGYYWSSTVFSNYAKLLVIEPLNAFGHSSPRSYGYSVRCIK